MSAPRRASWRAMPRLQPRKISNNMTTQPNEMKTNCQREDPAEGAAAGTGATAKRIMSLADWTAQTVADFSLRHAAKPDRKGPMHPLLQPWGRLAARRRDRDVRGPTVSFLLRCS